MAEKRLKKEEIERRKNHAKVLFTRDGVTTIKELSFQVGISEKTIGKWINEEGWQKLQKNFLLTREQEMANMLDELAELNKHIKNKPEGMRFADSKEGDVRRKLTKDIKELETSANLPEIIHVCKNVLDFIRKIDLTEAQKFSKYIDSYIKSQLS